MSEEPELSSIPTNPAAQSGSETGSAHSPKSTQGHHPDPQRIPPWLERAELFLRVLLRLYIGIAVCYAPWSHTFWDRNPLFTQFPIVGHYAALGAVRGIISGLGLLNLWIAFREAVRHRDG